MSSAANSMPRWTPRPKAAAGPDTGTMAPILNVFWAWASGGRARPAKSATVATVMTRESRIMKVLLGEGGRVAGPLAAGAIIGGPVSGARRWRGGGRRADRRR